MASLDILSVNPFNLKNKSMKIEHKKMLRGPSKNCKIFHGPSIYAKNIPWPPQKPSAHPPPLTPLPTNIMYSPLLYP